MHLIFAPFASDPKSGEFRIQHQALVEFHAAVTQPVPTAAAGLLTVAASLRLSHLQCFRLELGAGIFVGNRFRVRICRIKFDGFGKVSDCAVEIMFSFLGECPLSD